MLKLWGRKWSQTLINGDAAGQWHQKQRWPSRDYKSISKLIRMIFFWSTLAPLEYEIEFCMNREQFNLVTEIKDVCSGLKASKPVRKLVERELGHIQALAQCFSTVYGLNDMFPGNGVQQGFEIRFLLLGGCVKNVSPISSNMYNHAVLKRQLAQWVAQVKSFNMYPLQLGTRNDWRH